MAEEGAVLDDVQADDGNVDPDRAQHTEVELLAMEMGWNPNHKPAEGKESRSAADWIRGAERNNKNLKREINELKGSVERIAAAADKQVRREVEARAKEIEERFKEAVAASDTAAATRAANEMRELEREQPNNTAVPNEVAQFQRENSWYGTDPDATDYAVSVSNRLAREGVTDPATQLAKVREAVLKRFPEYGDQKPEQKKGATLNEPGARVQGKPRAKTFADLPDIARAAADRTYERMKTRNGDKAPDRKTFDANYAADYWSEQA